MSFAAGNTFLTGTPSRPRGAQRADLTDAGLDGADLTSARLDGANLTRASLWGANLTSASLAEADLTDARLYMANLTSAKFYVATLVRFLKEEDPTRALRGAYSTDARGLTQAQVEAALGNAATQLPAGLERPASWTAGQPAVVDATPASGAAPAAGDPPAPPTEHPR